jgi:hypothetical protein
MPLLSVASPVARADDASDLIPSESDLRAALAPLNLVNFRQGPGTDGWDIEQTFEISGGSDGTIRTTIDSSELPTSEGAAGFIQAKLQSIRDSARQNGFVGEIKPADSTLTMDADEAYLGVYMTPEGAPNRLLAAFLVSRYGEQVTGVQTLMTWDGSREITQSAQQAMGVVLGLVARQVNDYASED